MSHPHNHPSGPRKKQSPLVEATFVFRDVLRHPIEGLAVQIKAAAGASPAPAWIADQNTDTSSATTTGAAPGGGSPRAAAPMPAESPAATRSPSANDSAPNSVECISDKDGKAITIHNAARNQPIDVLVKNRRGEYVWKATVTPKKDISAFTIVSPEYHLDATTKLDGKGALEQNLELPVVKEGEVMTLERLVHEFGPYIGWSQKVTEQGEVRKDRPTKDKNTGQIEHHYRVVETGKPRTIPFNVLGSKLNYPKTFQIYDEKYEQIAKKLNCEIAAIKAIAKTESSGAPFCSNGLPKIRYERHYFFRSSLPVDKQAEKIYKKQPNPFPGHPDLCWPNSGGYTLSEPKDFGGWPTADDNFVAWQYERLIRASSLNPEAAVMACSWGDISGNGLFLQKMWLFKCR